MEEKDNLKNNKEKRKISIISVFLWIFLIVTMTTIVVGDIRNNNALEDEENYRQVYYEFEIKFSGEPDCPIKDISDFTNTPTVTYTVDCIDIGFSKTYNIDFEEVSKDITVVDDKNTRINFVFPLKLPIVEGIDNGTIDLKINGFKIDGYSVTGLDKNENYVRRIYYSNFKDSIGVTDFWQIVPVVYSKSIKLNKELYFILNDEDYPIEDISTFPKRPYINSYIWESGSQNIISNERIEISESGKTKEGELYIKFAHNMEVPIAENIVCEWEINNLSFKNYIANPYEIGLLRKNENGELEVVSSGDYGAIDYPFNENFEIIVNDDGNNYIINQFSLDYFEENLNEFVYLKANYVDKTKPENLPEIGDLNKVKLTSICKSNASHNIKPEYFNLIENLLEYPSNDYYELSEIRKEEETYLCDLTVKAENWMPKINEYLKENKNVDIEHLYDSCDNVVTFAYDSENRTWNPNKEEVVVYIKELGSITVTWSDGYTSTPMMTETIDRDYEKEDIFALYPKNPTRENYEFAGWEEWKIDEEGNIEIVAKWKEPLKYVISYEWEGLPEDNNVNIPIDNNSYGKDEKVKIDTSYKKGTIITVNGVEYEFSGWNSDDVEITDSYEITMPQKDILISGVWKEKKIKEEGKDVFEDYNLPNTSDINIVMYVIIFVVAIVILVIIVVLMRKNKK